MTSHERPAPWVLVAAGFHRYGGMDKANLALAEYLITQDTPVHLICHQADPELAKHPLVTLHRAALPAGSDFLGEPLLDFHGRRVARQITKRWPLAQVVVNGGNCVWPGINWVHCVHHAWLRPRLSGPAWFRIKQAASSSRYRKRERLAFQRAQLLIANSNLTAQHLVQHFRVDTNRIRTIYFGIDPEWGPVTPEERISSRAALEASGERPLVVFVGALGYDCNKGFDVLLEAWKKLCATADWDADLLVAGSGKAQKMFRREIAQSGLERRIRLLGFSRQVKDVLAAADLLVSPVRYEAYGLSVHEAICRGTPAMVSASAGVAERYESELSPMLIRDPEDVGDLVEGLLAWRSKKEEWTARFQQFGSRLRSRTWRDTAADIVSIVQQQERRLVERSRVSELAAGLNS